MIYFYPCLRLLANSSNSGDYHNPKFGLFETFPDCVGVQNELDFNLIKPEQKTFSVNSSFDSKILEEESPALDLHFLIG